MDSGDSRKSPEISSWREVDRCFAGKMMMKRLSEFDSESGASSEEFESPRSVWKVDSREVRFPVVHHQVLKIREEDSHLGEDIGEGLSAKEKLAFLHFRSNLDAFLRENRSEPILPASPLSGKTEIRSFH